MCAIKKGKEIKTHSDVRSLVTGLILRQENEYLPEEIEELARKYIGDGAYVINDYDLRQIILDDLDIMNRNDMVFGRNGHYVTREMASL